VNQRSIPLRRAFIRDDLVGVAKENPDVEFVVRRVKQGKAAILRGHYGEHVSMSRHNDSTDPIATPHGVVTGRDKVVCVNSLDRQQVANKVSFRCHSVVLPSHRTVLSFCTEAASTLFLTRVLGRTKQLDLILASGGGKIKHLKNIQLEAGPGAESARGVWSGVHSEMNAEGYRV
jgi:large subunit ribosomal protein L43